MKHLKNIIAGAIAFSIIVSFGFMVGLEKQERRKNSDALLCMKQRDRLGITFADLYKECQDDRDDSKKEKHD